MRLQKANIMTPLLFRWLISKGVYEAGDKKEESNEQSGG